MVVGKPEDNGEYVDVRFREPSYETKWESFKKAIYNPSTNAVFGRTGKSWAQLLLFYAIFYVILAALFAICMQGLLATLNDKEPTWTLDKSWIGTNPGLGVRPVSSRFEEGSLIWYNMTNQTQVSKWVHLINEFLAPYNASQTGRNYVNCDFDKPPGEGQVCATDLSKLGNCNHGRAYGYNSSSPCVFLKLNRIIGWEPDHYTTPEPDMPDELKIHIQNNTSSELEKKQVWVSCQGVDTIDRQHVKEFRYYPQGFASYYYPYRNYPNYLSPIVAVEIVNLTPNVIISIECRAWAKNIIYRGGVLNRAGSIQFEMQVDAATESQK